MGSKTLVVTAAAVVAIVALTSLSAVASIEKEPVKVTHKNSGPKYEIDDVERTKIVSQDSSENLVSPPRNPFLSALGGDAPQQPSSQSDDVAPIGHLSIRRIFLVPVTNMNWNAERPAEPTAATEQEAAPAPRPEHPRFWANNPFWPFIPPSRPHHMLGTDEASRSPTTAESNGVERPAQPERQVERQEEGANEMLPERPRPMIDPIQLMFDLMHHALNPQLASPDGPSLFKDLNKEASGSGEPEDKQRPKGENEDEKPLIPSAKNETKEEVVEIDGKKYLRKTVINRHVGENIIFMTKRLIFVPFNETTTTGNEEPTTTQVAPAGAPSSEAQNPTTTSTPISTEGSVPNQTTPQEQPSTEAAPAASEPKAEETTTTTTTTTTSAPISTTTEAASEAPSTSTSEPSTTTSGASATE